MSVVLTSLQKKSRDFIRHDIHEEGYNVSDLKYEACMDVTEPSSI